MEHKKRKGPYLKKRKGRDPFFKSAKGGRESARVQQMDDGARGSDHLQRRHAERRSGRSSCGGAGQVSGALSAGCDSHTRNSCTLSLIARSSPNNRSIAVPPPLFSPPYQPLSRPPHPLNTHIFRCQVGPHHDKRPHGLRVTPL